MNRSNSVETEYTYHNTGQGLFYSGEIKFSEYKKFRFIYDCGSENIRLINASVRRFRQDTGDDKIDLLIISHLHSDHVSGLNELFNNFTIKEVILPYFAPTERLLFALRRINMPAWYYEFLSDPVKYLFERKVERVIVLGGEEGGEGSIPPEDLPPNSPSERESPIKLDIEKLPDDENLKEEITQRDINWKKYINEKKLLIKNHNGYILALGLWLFRFFNYKVSRSRLQNFRNCLKRKGLQVSNTNIKKIIEDKRRLKNLKGCYSILGKHLKNDFNNTSLVLYHGPVGRPKSEISLLCFYPCYCYNRCVWPHGIFFEDINNSFGQFLTGDINFNMRYDELIRHYSNYLKNILITQIPHHGARKNWNKSIINDIPNSEFWIIPAGFKNRYGHPSYRVIMDICLNRKKYLWVNEMNYVKISGKIIW